MKNKKIIRNNSQKGRIPLLKINKCEDKGPITKIAPVLDIEKSPETIIITVEIINCFSNYILKPNTINNIFCLKMQDFSLKKKIKLNFFFYKYLYGLILNAFLNLYFKYIHRYRYIMLRG